MEAPAFTEPLQDCHVDEGRDIALRAIITGSQPVRVSWLHNGELELLTLNHLLVIKEGALKTHIHTQVQVFGIKMQHQVLFSISN